MTVRSTPVVRRATAADAEALAHLHLDVWDDYTGLMAQSILDDRRDETEARVERWRGILAGEHRTIVAEDEEGLVGFASTGPGRDAGTEDELELWALYVRARLWGTGVGHALLTEAIGARAAYLWVLAGNERSIRFYERQGFRLDGTSDEHDEGLHVRMVRSGS